jgi:hypothetical protein
MWLARRMLAGTWEVPLWYVAGSANVGRNLGGSAVVYPVMDQKRSHPGSGHVAETIC